MLHLAAAATTAPGGQLHEYKDGDVTPATFVLPPLTTNHRRLGLTSWSPILSWVQAALLILGTASVRDLFPSMVQVPAPDSRPISVVLGVVANLLEHQLVWSNISRGGTSVALSQDPWVVANLLEHQLVWSSIPHGGTSIALSQDPEIHVSLEALPADQISLGLSTPPSLNIDDLVPRAMHHIHRGTSIVVPCDIQQSGTLASEPGPASATVGLWSSSWAQGTMYFLNFMIVMVLLLAAPVATLQEP